VSQSCTKAAHEDASMEAGAADISAGDDVGSGGGGGAVGTERRRGELIEGGLLCSCCDSLEFFNLRDADERFFCERALPPPAGVTFAA
jgi:hypothetical protein